MRRQSKMAKRKANFTMSPVKKTKYITEEIELSKICEEKKSVTVHGVVTSLSPVKESKTKVKYFRGTIADQSKKVPVVSFEPKLWKRLNQSHENCSTVALVNCNIQEARNRSSGDYEIVASSRTEVTESERQFEIASEEDEQTTMDELCQLAPNSITSIVAKVKTVEAPVRIQCKSKAQQLAKQDCFIGDETGMCRLVLWEENIGTVVEGQTYKFKKMLVRQFSGINYLSKTEESVIEHADDIDEVNCDFVQHEDTTCTQKAVVGDIISVLSCEEYPCCSECCSKMEPKGACGTCTRCGTMVRLSKCPTSTTARIKIERDGGGYEIVSVFNNTIATIVGYADCESSATTMEKLLQTPRLTFFINSKGTVSGVTQVEKATWRSSKEAVKETLGVDN